MKSVFLLALLILPVIISTFDGKLRKLPRLAAFFSATQACRKLLFVRNAE